MDFLFSSRIILLAPNLARPCPAAPPGAPTRPARGMSGFWIRQVSHRFTLSSVCSCLPRIVQDSCPRSPVVQDGTRDGYPWTNRPVGVPSCPAPPCPATPPCAASTRPARGIPGLWNRIFKMLKFPNMPCMKHEKGLQRQKGAGPLVSSKMISRR